ncbi:MAG: PD-(D/E)XK nuclease family protein [Bacteroidetes bacterium]|nr:PD-(D/E)XK nuclease family protein [Bacteroidota bacterium]MCL1969373.1 PD-(D/E)XK nuclease family protein [Bacteroidota bacterium]
MSSFLAQLAEKIANNSEITLANTIVVVPNKRARRELLRELALHFTKPVFAPNILSVNEFIESFSSLKKIDNDELLMRLYEIYLKKEPEKNADFNVFLSWAPLFLTDINDIDLHLADANEIFTNLSDIKTLETSFGKENLTETQRIYLGFYKQLAGLYTDFTALLRAENVGYEGMIYKDVFLNHKEGTKSININLCDPCDKIYTESARYIFAGFNAATPAELELLQYFYVHKNAEFYFDIDIFYDEKYGTFIEEIRQKLRITEIPKSNHYKDIPKRIFSIGVPKRTAQIYKTIEILNEIEQKQGNLNDTVLVLADETMLLPLVHAYNTEKANITMGYPLNATFAARQLLQCIEEEKHNNRLQKPIYHLKTQGFEFLRNLKIQLQTGRNENISLGNESAYSLVITLVEDVYEFLKKFFAENTILDFVIVEYFLKEKLNATMIPFTGNVQEGLQIMGLLETRMLDFKNIIVLSMNEGVLPKGKATPSMLLYEIRKHFGLPTHQHKDDIFGYHFFRLLQRAENVYLIYDNESSYTLAEKSRFMKQLEFEIKKQQLQKSIHFFEEQYVPVFKAPEKETKISIEKTNTIIEKLIHFKYSPTSLNTYIQCPLQFYFKFIEEISVPETFDQTNESAVIGTVIHRVLEEIFKELKENPAQFSNILSKYENSIEDILIRIFRAQPEIGNEEITRGKLYLAFHIAQKSISDYLQIIRKEWENDPFQIIANEISLEAEVSLMEYRLCLKGTADRIEMRDNKVTILDYKTGKVDAKKLQCCTEDFETVFTNPENSQLFQLLCYACLYKNSHHLSLVPANEFQCGIISFQEIYQQNADYICYAKIDKVQILTDKILQMFEDSLKQLFSSILDEKTPFCQTNDPEKNCVYCDYKGICNLLG